MPCQKAPIINTHALLIQIVLIALNAVFASAELAVLSVNEGKIDRLAEQGNRKAKRLRNLTKEPAKFLSTIQIAITLSGFLGSAFAADGFSDPLVDWLIGLGVPLSRSVLDTLSVIFITLILSYFTLIFGELVPKRIAMKKSEALALGVSGVVSGISVLFKPIVWLLSISTNAVLRLLGIDPNEEVDACYDGDSALDWLLAEKYDLILLDLNLPGRDGMELLRALRERDRETRVLILSARSRISDKVEGLDCGANDYLVKPFHLEELEARVRGLTRRSFVQHDAVLRCGELSFDTVKRTAQAKGENVALTRKENGILEYLLLNQGRPVSQEELMEHVWDGSVDSFSNSIRVHISSLRKKLKAALGYDPIVNRIGEGYLMGGREP